VNDIEKKPKERLRVSGAMRTATRGALRAPLFVYSLLLLSYLINAMDRQLFSILAVDVRTQLHLSLIQVGFAATVFTLGIGIAGIPTGYLFSRLPRKYVAVVGLALFSLATWATAYSYGYADLLFYRFISGMGESIQLIAILAMGTSFFHRHKAVAAGAVNSTFGLGAIIGPNLGVALLKGYDWKMPFIVFGTAGFIMLVLCLLFVDRGFSEYERPVNTPVRQGSGKVAASTGTTWLLVGATILAGFVVYGYLGLYPTFLRTELGFSPAEAAFASSCYGVGGFLSVLGGWLGDRFEYRRILKLAFCVTTLCGGLLFTGLGHSIYLHALLSFVFGSTASGVLFANLITGIIRSLPPSKGSSFGAGLYVAAFYIPAAFAGYVLAVLKSAFGWPVASGIQLVGCSIGALILVQLAKTPSFRKTEADTDLDAESGAKAAQAH
jgi:MFS transporter, DHA1 family, inner membrane transport protein